jgi:hypothetical protein
VQAAIVVSLLALASNAEAALVYFDAQIHDINTGKTVVPKNTVQCDPRQGCAETPFTAQPSPTDPAGNWTLDASGSDGLWRQRTAANFGNPDASGGGTVYESRGLFNGPNTEDPSILKTTVNVPAQDQGTLKGVYAMFWVDTSSWQIAACLECVEDERMPNYVGGNHMVTATDGSVLPGYVFGVYDVGVGDPGNLSPQDVEMNGYTTSDSMPGGTGGTGRRLKAAWLGNVVLGSALSVWVGDGPLGPNTSGDGAHNYRAWYDGIAYGDVQDLDPLPCIPEPASLVLLGIAATSLGLVRRRKAG